MSNKTNIPFWVFLSLLWGQFFLALYPSWADGTYYDYGFLVPPLLVYFFFVRWKSLKTKSAPGIEDQDSHPLTALQISIAVIAIFLLLALRLIETIDSGWRLPLYLHGFIVLAVSTVLLASRTGRKGITHFSPVALLAFFAVPLPSSVEVILIQRLTDSVTDTAVFANQWMGYPVVASGQTLLVNSIPLHVSEGCSGIRSFQGSIFAGFVAGEFFLLPVVHRIVLIASGLIIAFVANTTRVVYLVRHAALKGDDSLEAIHDVSGYVSLTATLLLLVGIAWWFSTMNSRETGNPLL